MSRCHFQRWMTNATLNQRLLSSNRLYAKHGKFFLRIPSCLQLLVVADRTSIPNSQNSIGCRETLSAVAMSKKRRQGRGGGRMLSRRRRRLPSRLLVGRSLVEFALRYCQVFIELAKPRQIAGGQLHPRRGMTAGPEEEIALLMRRWEQVKAGDGAVVLIGGEPGNREIAPRAAAHRVAEAKKARIFCAFLHSGSTRTSQHRHKCRRRRESVRCQWVRSRAAGKGICFVDL